MKKFSSPSTYSTPTIYSIDSPNSTKRDLAGLDVEGRYCYTPCNLILELRSPFPLVLFFISKTLASYPLLFYSLFIP